MKLFAPLRPTRSKARCENCNQVGFKRIPGPAPAKLLHDLDRKLRAEGRR